jgi:hypothetical protein
MTVASGNVSVSYTNSRGDVVNQMGARNTPLAIQETAQVDGTVVKLPSPRSQPL